MSLIFSYFHTLLIQTKLAVLVFLFFSTEFSYQRIVLYILQMSFLLIGSLACVQTDPNWSNFLYDEASKIINLIDFGAARDFPRSFVDDYLRMVFSWLIILLFSLPIEHISCWTCYIFPSKSTVDGQEAYTCYFQLCFLQILYRLLTRKHVKFILLLLPCSPLIYAIFASLFVALEKLKFRLVQIADDLVATAWRFLILQNATFKMILFSYFLGSGQYI